MFPLEGSAALPRAGPARSRRSRGRLAVGQRYWAFLSYSHEDSEVADWLHEALEAFRVPTGLVGRLTSMGPVPSRLSPIFRDRHDLAAGSSLNEDIEEAIAGSRFLLVLCSPTAARSPWTNEEIACFKRLQSEDRVLAAIVAGEPFASDIPGREHEECFPPALRTHFTRRGTPTAKRAEPIAADLREDRDGRKAGFLKIVAGMLGVGLDELVQRETVRRHRRTNLIVAGSIAGMLVTTGLSVAAIQARDAAREQRREAEGLIGFMLGDLREKLEPIGRLDVLDSVGTRALAYYEKQDKGSLSDAALAQRSRALTLMGEMANARGDLDGALRRYREAMAGTAEAVRREPDNPQHLFDHAQNVFWVGYVDWQRGDMDKAGKAFREYRRLADRMIALAPGNRDYRLERLYADTNLGTVLIEQRRYREAADVFQAALGPIETLAASDPANLELRRHLIETLGWLADAREFSGQLDEALAHRRRQLALLAQMWRPGSGDTTLKRQELAARRSLARLLAARGDLPAAMEQSRAASAAIAFLARIEPNNTEWQQAGAATNLERADLELASGRTDLAEAAAQAGCNAGTGLLRRDRSVDHWRTTLQLSCIRARGRIALRNGANGEAVTLAQEGLTLARTESNAVERGLAMAGAEAALGDALAASEPQSARGAYQRALQVWPRNIEERPRDMAQHAILFRRAGRPDEARPIMRTLAAMGYREPAYLKAMQQGE